MQMAIKEETGVVQSAMLARASTCIHRLAQVNSHDDRETGRISMVELVCEVHHHNFQKQEKGLIHAHAISA